MRFHRRTAGLAFAILLCAAIASAAAVGAGASAKRGASSTLTVGVLHAFTGPTSFFGESAQIACKAAAIQINAAGGVMGNQIACQDFDTKGDPADAVPVTARMLATTSNLVAVLGPDGNDIPSVLPLITQAKVPEINTVGDPRYDKQTSPYFWRFTSSDSTQGPAEAYYAVKVKHFTKIAEVFTNDLSAQTVIAPFEKKLKALHGAAVIKLTLSAGAASYQTEVARLLAKHPQAIVGDLDTRTAATFLSEVQQQNNRSLPYIGGPQTVQGDWTDAATKALGAGSVARYVSAIAANTAAPKLAASTFLAAVTKAGANDFQKHNAYIAAQYDAVIVFALAMDMAKTTSSAYVSKIPQVTLAQGGATKVFTYKQALNALAQGKTIRYVGASGFINFDKYNTADRSYSGQRYDAKSQSWVNAGFIPKSETLP
jgi:branched-chain amino acid transport system substrate-binding protein